jgi:hypothetical protein
MAEDVKTGKDSLQSLFEGIESELLTDDVKLQIATLFEASVNEAIAQKEQELEESNKTELATFKEDLVAQCDSYLEYFTKEYIKENEQIVEDFTKVRLAEKVLRNFQQMVEAFNVSLSDESVSSEEEIDELKTENTKLVNKLIESRKETETVKKATMISEASGKLETDMQRDKLVEMAKKLEFDEELFSEKLEVLVTKILTEKVEAAPEKLEEKVEAAAPEKKVASTMSSYLQNI